MLVHRHRITYDEFVDETDKKYRRYSSLHWKYCKQSNSVWYKVFDEELRIKLENDYKIWCSGRI